MEKHIETQMDTNTKWEKICNCKKLDFCSQYNKKGNKFLELYCVICGKSLKRRKDLE